VIKSTISQEWHGGEVKIQGRKVVNRSSYEIGLVVEGQAKELCPVDSGRLAGSITTQSQTEGTQPEAPALAVDVISKPTDEGEVLVGTPVEYGVYREFGTIKSDAQPFLRPALALAQGKVITIVERNAKMHMQPYLQEHDAYLKSRGII
jgi:HK97 gp10 family phage protein